MFAIDENVWIEACAGSGKTTLLIDRIVQFLLHGVPSQKILIITFTNNACDEISERIEKILLKMQQDQAFCKEILNKFTLAIDEKNLQLAQNLWEKNLLQPLQIKTIHGFCHEILQKFLSPDEINEEVQIISEIKSRQLLDESLKEYIQKRICAEKPDDIDENHLLLTHSWETVLNFLNNLKDKKLDFNYFNDKLHKINYRPESVEKIKNLHIDPDEKDFSAYQIVLEWLNSDKKFADYEKFRTLFFTTTNEKRTRRIKINNLILADFISAEEQNILQWEEFFLLNLNLKKIVFFREVLHIYAQKKQEYHLFDYADLIELVTQKLRQNCEISYLLDGQIEHVIVDEAQDNSPLQWQILLHIVGEFFAGAGAQSPKRTFFVVGDPKQSIFSFQGASLQEFVTKKEIFLQLSQDCGAQTQYLQKNDSYRNPQAVISLLNQIFQDREILQHFALEKIEFTTHNTRIGGVFVHPLVEKEMENNSELQSENIIKIEFENKENFEFDTEKEQKKDTQIMSLAEKIVDCVKDLLRENNPNEILILVQKRGRTLKYLQDELAKREIDFYFGQVIDLKNNDFCHELINFAKLVCNPEFDYEWIAFEKSAFNVDDFSLEVNAPANHNMQSIWQIISQNNPQLKKFIERYHQTSIKNSVFQFFLQIWQDFSEILIKKFSAEAQKIWQLFLDQVLQFEKENDDNLQSFLLFWEESSEIIASCQQNGVQICTVHGAKGGERKIVIIADASEIPKINLENLFFYHDLPFFHQKNNFLCKAILQQEKVRQYREYLRLMYVAITRAQEQLHIFGRENNNKFKSWYEIIANVLGQ